MRVPATLAALVLCVPLSPVNDTRSLANIADSTSKVCQLTGDYDRAAGVSTRSLTARRFGITGTDLGSTLEHKGKLYFLFGDTWGRPGDHDAIGWTQSKDPERILLEFHRGKDRKWIPPKVPGIGHGSFEIPSGGISLGGVMYVVFTEDLNGKDMGRSVLTRSRDDGQTFETLFELSRSKFINLSFWTDNNWVYIYGSGEYRKSSVCLARVKRSDIEIRSRWVYFNVADFAGTWRPNEEQAIPLFKHDVVGEFSVAYLPPVKRYVMLYNSSSPRGITLRSARNPWGPWSDGTVIFDPWRDKGYGRFMHVPPRDSRTSDSLHDPGREQEFGGEYGPYILARYTRGTTESCTIYFTMSTWNPYQVVIMKSDLKLDQRR